MSKIKIEKGISYGSSKTKQCGPVSTTFVFEMEEGDSIVLPLKNANSLRAYVRKNFKDWRVLQRKLPDGNYRVWKVRRDK
tara:strand:+ start:275 stop:514 length:240 start_codon:yes stop_codon:yes gene_type:complete